MLLSKGFGTLPLPRRTGPITPSDVGAAVREHPSSHSPFSLQHYGGNEKLGAALGFSLPSQFSITFPDPRVNVPSNVCVSASGSPFGPVIFGPPGEEKQDLLIPYLLAVIPKEPAGPGSSSAGWQIPPGTWECWDPKLCLGGTRGGQTKPWSRCSAGMGGFCWDRDEPGTGCARARALPAGATFAGASGKARGV